MAVPTASVAAETAPATAGYAEKTVFRLVKAPITPGMICSELIMMVLFMLRWASLTLSCATDNASCAAFSLSAASFASLLLGPYFADGFVVCFLGGL